MSKEVNPATGCTVEGFVVLSSLAMKIYNSGYRSGHEDTCEGRYVNVLECDIATYHDDIVKEIISEHNATGQPRLAQTKKEV